MVIIGLLTLWFYTYIGIPPAYPVRFEREDVNYYSLLTGGFLHGKTTLSVEPPAALLALADPYDPAQRAQAGNVGLHDATYYKGKYYLYFGVTPALALFVPFKLLTGLYFPQNLATILFFAGGFCCSVLLLLDLCRVCFPAAGPWCLWLGTLGLAFGNFALPTVVRNSIWELPISCGYFCSMLGLWCAGRYWNEEGNRRLRWPLAASTAFGFAVGCRPHLVFGAAALGALWLFAQWRRRAAAGTPSLRSLGREATALFLPFALIVFGLLCYNEARFGQFSEFGQKYQLAGNRQVDSQLLSARFIPANFYYYFIAPAQWERYFPFFQAIRGYPGVRPPDYGGSENPFGLLPNMPVTWLALAAPVLWLAAFRMDRRIPGYLAIFGLYFAATATAVMCFAWSATRYMVDFVPSLLLCAVLGLILIFRLDRVHFRWRRKIGIAVGILAVGGTTIFTTFITFRHEVFRAHRPTQFAALAGIFNRPTFWWEKMYPEKYGPIRMTVLFPRDQPGRVEPLVVSGVSFLTDYLYVYYFPDAKRVQIRFNHTNYNELISQPITADFEVPHRIEIDAGMLYPIESHPFFAGWPRAKVEEARHVLQVRLDGVPYLLARQDFFDPSPEHLTVAENRVSDYIGKRFTGEILEFKHQPLSAPTEFSGRGVLRLALKLGTDASAVGRQEALVTTGAPGRQDTLAIKYEGPATARLVFLHDGDVPRLTPPLTFQPTDIQLLDVSLGSFYSSPRNSREKELAGQLIVRINGQTLWQEPATFHPAGLAIPEIGKATVQAEAFSGTIVTRETIQLFAAAPASSFAVAPYWLETGDKSTFGAMRLHLDFPVGASRTEPLVVSGATAAKADYIFLTYFPGNQATFGYLHAGTSAVQGSRIRTGEGRPWLVEISLPSFYPLDSSPFFAATPLASIAEMKRKRVLVRVNGRPVLESAVAQAYEATPQQVTVGLDRLEQAFGARFSGQVHAVERASLQPPAGLSENEGPLELTLVFPDHPDPGTEPLLATGNGDQLDQLAIVYESPTRAHLRVQTVAGQTKSSETLVLDASPHVFRVHWGSLRSPALPSGPDDPQTETFRIEFDGKNVLEGQGDFVRGDPLKLILGGSAGGTESFSGRLLQVRRLP